MIQPNQILVVVIEKNKNNKVDGYHIIVTKKWNTRSTRIHPTN